MVACTRTLKECIHGEGVTELWVTEVVEELFERVDTVGPWVTYDVVDGAPHAVFQQVEAGALVEIEEQLED